MNELENISFATILNAFRGIIREEVQSVLEEEQERKSVCQKYKECNGEVLKGKYKCSL